jgi:predicted transposase YbfD/YdcC
LRKWILFPALLFWEGLVSGLFRISFQGLPDPRTGNARRHALLEVLTIALTASVCGAESCVDFALFARDRRALFEEFLELPGGLPSHDTFSRIFRLLDPAAFSRCFQQFLDHLGEDGRGVLAIDGKTLRRSFDRAAGRSALHVVTAFAAGARMVVGQRAVADGENEIVAARALLELFDLKGVLVTGDALHAQAETARTILDRGGDWLFPLKDNRPALRAEVARYFDDPATAPTDAHVTTDANHGRVEVRRHRVSHDVAWLASDRRFPDEATLPGLKTLGQIERTVTTPDGKTTTTRTLYLSSATLNARTLAKAARDHWSIEAAVHWVLDTSFDEDRARNRKDHGPENLATLRKLALNVVRAAKNDDSIRLRRKRAGWSDDYARTILGQMR